MAEAMLSSPESPTFIDAEVPVQKQESMTALQRIKHKKQTGGKGLGKHFPAKRHVHRRILRGNIEGITNPAIKRLARRGGVKRMSQLVPAEARGVLKQWLENIMKDVVTYTEHARRKTVTSNDVIHALKRNHISYYG